MTKVDILAIGVHPDDVELSAAGTLLHQAARGYRFGLLDLTCGELGTRGTAAIRLAEGAEAARIMGAAFRETLDMPDGLFTLAPEYWMRIVRVLRACQPDIVLCNAPDDRHPDHGRAARLTLDACFYAGLLKIRTYDAQGLAQERWRPRAVYHYIQDKQLAPDFVIDITPYFDKKREAMAAFRSQFFDKTTEEDGPSTPISGQDFWDFMEAKARVFGRSIQVEFAEGFTVARVPGVKDLFDLL